MMGNRSRPPQLSTVTWRPLLRNVRSIHASCLNTGLLSCAQDNYFTTKMDLHNAAFLLKASDAVFRCAIARDIERSGQASEEYLRDVKKKASKYLQEENICGRAAIMDDIEDAILEKGSFTFITDGRSLGKSKIVRRIANTLNDEQTPFAERLRPRVCVVMVDGRDNKDLVASLSSLAAASAKTQMLKVLGVVTEQSSKGKSTNVEFFKVDFTHKTVTEAVEVLANWHPENTDHTVLILDEANAFFMGKDAQSVRDLFDAVVKRTKQLEQMSVLLVSSDAGLPLHLLGLGLNRQHITDTLVVHEATPQECRDLLQKKLGVGEHLSNALLDYFGGNVYQICLFLRHLPREYEGGDKIKVFLGPADDIRMAIDTWKSDKQNKEDEILEVLGELARTGIVPMSANNNLARVLTKYNVCAYLTDDAKQYQVPEEVRADRAGLIPDSQLLRMLIARTLVELEVAKEQSAGK